MDCDFVHTPASALRRLKRCLFIFTDELSNLCHIISGKFVILFIRPRPPCGLESTAFVHFHRLFSRLIVILFRLSLWFCSYARVRLWI